MRKSFIVCLVLAATALTCVPCTAEGRGVPAEITEYLMKVCVIQGKVELLFSQVDRQMNRNRRDIEGMAAGAQRDALIRERFRQFDLLLADLDALNDEASKIAPPSSLQTAHTHFLLYIQTRSLGMRMTQMQFITGKEQYGKSAELLMAQSEREALAFGLMLRAIAAGREGAK
jgi:hypothetical protein